MHSHVRCKASFSFSFLFEVLRAIWGTVLKKNQRKVKKAHTHKTYEVPRAAVSSQVRERSVDSAARKALHLDEKRKRKEEMGEKTVPIWEGRRRRDPLAETQEKKGK